MSLSLGTLTGFLDLDSSGFDSGLSGAESKLSGFGGKGAAIAAGAGIAIGGALAAGVIGAMNVEAANDKLSAQLGLTAAESERIGGVAGSLYADAYGGSLEEVNTAVGAVMSSISGMRNASSADIEAMSVSVLNLASGFEVDVTRAAQVAGQMITSGLAGDGAEAMDLLTAAMQRVPAAVREDILDAVDEYGPFMASLGLQGEQAFGLLVTAAEKGAFGIDKTGDALKEFTIRATDMSAASKVGFDALGLSQEEMTGKLLAGGETAAGAFDQIVTGLVGIKDPAAQSQAALALFGTPLEDLNTQEIPAFLASLAGASDAMDGSAGSAERFGTSLNDNATASLTSLKRKAEQAVVGLANGLLPAVNDVTGALATGFGPALAVAAAAVVAMSGVVTDATDFLVEHETTTKVLAGVILALMVPTLVSLTTGYVTTGAAAVASGVAQSAAWLRVQVQALATGVVLGVTYALTIAGWIGSAAAATAGGIAIAAAWLMALGPVALVILGIAAVVAILVVAWNHSETFRDIVTGAFGKVLGAVSALLGGFESMLRGLSKVPGFGWADTAADKVAAARGAIDGLNASLGRIPASKNVIVTTRFVVIGDPNLSTRGGVVERASGGPVASFSSYLIEGVPA